MMYLRDIEINLTNKYYEFSHLIIIVLKYAQIPSSSYKWCRFSPLLPAFLSTRVASFSFIFSFRSLFSFSPSMEIHTTVSIIKKNLDCFFTAIQLNICSVQAHTAVPERPEELCWYANVQFIHTQTRHLLLCVSAYTSRACHVPLQDTNKIILGQPKCTFENSSKQYQ